MRRLLVFAVLLVACAPSQEWTGADVIWESDDDRVIRAGPCVVTQTWDDYIRRWLTIHTDCTEASE